MDKTININTESNIDMIKEMNLDEKNKLNRNNNEFTLEK